MLIKNYMMYIEYFQYNLSYYFTKYIIFRKGKNIFIFNKIFVLLIYFVNINNLLSQVPQDKYDKLRSKYIGERKKNDSLETSNIKLQGKFDQQLIGLKAYKKKIKEYKKKIKEYQEELSENNNLINYYSSSIYSLIADTTRNNSEKRILIEEYERKLTNVEREKDSLYVKIKEDIEIKSNLQANLYQGKLNEQDLSEKIARLEKKSFKVIGITKKRNSKVILQHDSNERRNKFSNIYFEYNTESNSTYYYTIYKIDVNSQYEPYSKPNPVNPSRESLIKEDLINMTAGKYRIELKKSYQGIREKIIDYEFVLR